MKKALAVLLLSLFCLIHPAAFFGQHGPVHARLGEVRHKASIPALTPPYFGIRYWDKGYLVSYEEDGTPYASPTKAAVELYDKEGHIAREAIVWPKGAESATVEDAAVTRSGELIVAGWATDSHGVYADFVAAIDNTGHISRMIQTTPFSSDLICSGDDGTVWAYGMQPDDHGKTHDTAPRLRQFSFDKGQLKAMVDLSNLNAAGWQLHTGAYPGQMSLRCTSHTVGLFNGASSEWIKFDIPSGKLTVSKVKPLPSVADMRITGFALTESGEVFASLYDRLAKRSGLFRLSFDSSELGSWDAVDGTVGPVSQNSSFELLGADGDGLIYTRNSDGTTYWSAIVK